MRATIAALASAALLAGAPAAAQVPAPPELPIFPRPGQPTPPPSPPPAPPRDPGSGAPLAPGDTGAYRANAGRTNAAPEEATVWGPLRRVWTKTFAGHVNQPLVVGGRVIVNASFRSTGYGSRVVAYDARDGRQLWEQPTPGTYFTAPIAADGATVVSVNQDGVARAFAVADGRPRWQVELNAPYGASAPLVVGGRVLVWVASRGVEALAVADGARLWSRPVTLVGAGLMAADDRRVFVTGECGRAIAIDQASGAVAWTRHQSGETCFAAGAAIAGGRLLPGSRGGQTYRTDTGADAARFPHGTPHAIAGGLAFLAFPPTRAIGLADGALRWTQARFGGLFPFVVGPTLYVTSRDERWLRGLDRESGRLMSTTLLPPRQSRSAVGGLDPGMAAGAGRLAVAQGGLLAVYANVLAPREGGLDVAATSYEVVGPKRIAFAGGLHPGMRGRASAMELQLDPHPFGRFRPAHREPIAPDGTAYFDFERIRRNTRVRVRAVGAAARSATPTVVVYPRFAVGLRALGGRRVRARVRLSAGRDFRAGGRRVVLYLYRAGARRNHRLGAATLRQTRPGVAVADVRFALPRRLARRDTLAYCIPRMPRLGYGGYDALQRRCGRRVVPE